MLLSALITALQDQLVNNGDLEVLLTVENDDGAAHGNAISVTCEQDHGTEDMFIRISGDDAE